MKTAIKAICAFFLATALFCMAYVHFRSDAIEAKILSLLREQLTTDLCVRQFNIDGWSAFPGICIVLKDVSLDGKGGNTLVEAGDIEITMSLFSAFSSDIRFKKLLLKDGALRIEKLKDGSLSLDIVRNDGTSTSPGPMLHFRKIALENFRITYLDPAAKQQYQLTFEEGEIRGTYGYQSLKCKLNGSATYDYARIGNTQYLNGIRGNLNTNIEADFARSLFTFHEIHLKMGALQYNINGTVRSPEDYTHVDLKIAQTAGDVRTFFSILPSGYRNVLPFDIPKGEFLATGLVQGRMHKTESPQVHFDLMLKDADIRSHQGNGVIHHVAAKGSLDNGSMQSLRTTTLDFPEINGSAFGDKLSGSVHLTDFDDPLLNCRFDGALPLQFIIDYAGAGTQVRESSGVLHFSDVEVESVRISQFDYTDINKVHGTCELRDLKFRSKHSSYSIPIGTLTLRQDTLTIEGLTAASGKDKLKADGWLTHLGEALEGNDPGYLRYSMKIEAEELHTSEWVPTVSGTEGKKPLVKPATYHTYAPLRLPEGELQLTADLLSHDNLVIEHLKGQVSTTLHHLQFNTDGNVADGMLHARGTLETSEGYTLHIAAQGEGLDLHECFFQCNNFSQKVIRAEHLKGKSDFLLLADVPWTPDGHLLQDQISLSAGMTVKNGELVNFEMLDQFSNYVHAQDLKHIRFARLDNFIIIRKGNVYLPVMFIQSNALNLMVNGIHTLDNEILYNIKLNAGQVVSSKIKKHNPALSPLPARRDGTFNMFFTISGTVDNFSYDTKRRQVESSFSQSAELRERIRTQLLDEFGASLDFIEPPDWETIPEYDLEQDGEDVFLDMGN